VAHATKGDFKVLITVAGELRSSSFVQIQGPTTAQQVGVYQMKLQSIVPEGTVVKMGDTVAELDRGPLATQLTNFNLSLQKATAVFDQAELDTTLNLSKAREDLHSMEVALVEKNIAKEQSKYEAPSTRRQADIDYEKAERALAQGKVDFKTKTEQAMAKMREVGADLDRQKNSLKMIQDVMGEFTIKAPSAGMVIYVKEWNGRKRTAGSQVSPWDPSVATLPDLTKMESLTYVNEIDVRKVSVGQPVAISLDADPDKHLSGKVLEIANVGEDRPNSDAKVFEVKIQVTSPDTSLRPGMTTGNAIETFVVKDAISVPLEAVTSENNVPYVYKRAGGKIIKQEVETGAVNETHVVIARGVENGESVLLVPPENHLALAGTRLPGSTAGTKPNSGDAPASKSVPVTPGASRKPEPVKPGAKK
jgi:RND family efflux transporter MFP subunit